MSVLRWLNWLIGQEAFVGKQVESRLRAKPHLALNHVFCAWRNGVLTLSGCVPTHSLRRIAEALARRVEGIEHIENDIEVAAPLPLEVLARLTVVRGPERRHEQQS